MAALRYACRVCGTWKCIQCGWKRPGASVAYERHQCLECNGLAGTLVPTMHTERMWRAHNSGQLPEGYPFGTRPPGDLVPPFGSRTAGTGWPLYRGIRVPQSGPYGRTDLKSWKLGVDHALESLGIPPDTDLREWSVTVWPNDSRQKGG